jgi:hypothetical protein
VRFGSTHRRADGLQIKVGKLLDKDHFIPLKAFELAEIDSWSCSDTGPWITNAAGKPMSGSAQGFALHAFLTGAPELSRAPSEAPRASRYGDRLLTDSRIRRSPRSSVSRYGDALFETHRYKGARRTKGALDCKKVAFLIVKSEFLRLEIIKEVDPPPLTAR